MHLAGFEPAIPSGDRPQTLASHRLATGSAKNILLGMNLGILCGPYRAKKKSFVKKPKIALTNYDQRGVIKKERAFVGFFIKTKFRGFLQKLDK